MEKPCEGFFPVQRGGCCMFTLGTRAAGTLLPSAGHCLGCPSVWQCIWGHGLSVQHLVGCHDISKYSLISRSINVSTVFSQEVLWMKNLVGNIQVNRLKSGCTEISTGMEHHLGPTKISLGNSRRFASLCLETLGTNLTSS